MGYLQYSAFENNTSFNNVYMTRKCKKCESLKNNNYLLHLINSSSREILCVWAIISYFANKRQDVTGAV